MANHATLTEHASSHTVCAVPRTQLAIHTQTHTHTHTHTYLCW
jgi:hypothetical protein